MRVAIAGAGNVGLFIANDLRAADHDVMIIEQSPAVVKRSQTASDGIDWHVADCCEVNSLRAAGLDACDVVVAATEHVIAASAGTASLDLASGLKAIASVTSFAVSHE